MKVLQIGGGSMGTRRMRDLREREDVEMALLDFRDDRVDRAKKRFGITTFTEKNAAFAWKPDALIISTPPDKHDGYVETALDRGLHHFCEENIWTYDYLKVANVSRAKGIVSAPSCSFHFLPMFKKMKELLDDGAIGALHSYQMLLSTYMPSWHPEEGNEFYARNRNTAAGREMVPFELVWLNNLFGTPKSVNGVVARCGNLKNDFEDSWSLQMSLNPSGLGTLTVLQGARPIVRRGLCVGENGTMDFDLVSGELRVLTAHPEHSETIDCGTQSEVIERTYFEEINTFIDTVKGEKEWPHTYRDSALATATLAAAETSAATSVLTVVDPERQPASQLTHKF